MLGGKNAVIPSGVVGIGKYAFAYREIERIVIPESVTDIGSYAFESCTALTEVVFEGNGLTKIWGYAFYKCTGITRLELPASVTYVGAHTFLNWTAEQTIVIKGFASKKEADEAWSGLWDFSCNATIIYEKEETEL